MKQSLVGKQIFFRGVAQEEIPIRQYRGWSPLFFTRASMMGAVFTAKLSAVQSLMPTNQHRPLRVGPRRALVAIHCFEYQESQIGPYSEVVLSIPVHCGAGPAAGPLRLARSALTGEFHSYVFQLPVDSEVALFGGLDYFNVPKYMTRIESERDNERRTCRVSDLETGDLIFEFSGPRLVTKRHAQSHRTRQTRPTRHDAGELKTLSMHTYPVIDGKVRKATGTINLVQEAAQFMPRDVELELGNHPRATQIRGLELGRAIQYAYVPDCQMILSLPGPLGVLRFPPLCGPPNRGNLREAPGAQNAPEAPTMKPEEEDLSESERLPHQIAPPTPSETKPTPNKISPTT